MINSIITPEKLLQLATVYGACMCAAVVVELFIEGFKGATNGNNETDHEDGISLVCSVSDNLAVYECDLVGYVENIIYRGFYFYHDYDCFTR